jgi:hypothetical protein
MAEKKKVRDTVSGPRFEQPVFLRDGSELQLHVDVLIF